MVSGNGRQLCILTFVIIFLVVFLAYENYMRRSQIDTLLIKVNKQELFSQDIVYKYQDCLRRSQEWGAKYDSQRQATDDMRGRLESLTAERQKSEKQLTDSLTAANSRVELLEGQVKSLTAQKLHSAEGKDATPEDKEAKELVQSLRAQMSELQQKLKVAAAVAVPAPTAASAMTKAGKASAAASVNVTKKA